MSKTLAWISGAAQRFCSGGLADPDRVAAEIWDLPDRGLENGSVVDLRTFSEAPAG